MMREGPYASDYFPVGCYPESEAGVHEGGWMVDLSVAARERAAMIEAFEGVGRGQG